MSRTITHDTRTGPGLLRLRLPVGHITVTAVEGHRRATVRLTPQHGDDQAAALSPATASCPDGQRVAATVTPAEHAQLAASTDVPRPSGAAGRDTEWAAYLATATARRTS